MKVKSDSEEDDSCEDEYAYAITSVISTKCPVLNMAFRREVMRSSPDLEVLVGIEENPMEDVPAGIMCPMYTAEKKCEYRPEGCIYKNGWKSLK